METCFYERLAALSPPTGIIFHRYFHFVPETYNAAEPARSGVFPMLVSTGIGQLMVICLPLRYLIRSVPRCVSWSQSNFRQHLSAESSWRNRTMEKDKNASAGENTNITKKNEG